MSQLFLLLHNPEQINGSLATIYEDSGSSRSIHESIQDPLLRNACENDVRVMVLDVAQEKIGGLLDSVRDMPESLRPYVIAVCNSGDSQSCISELLDLGVDDVIVTPVDKVQLRSRMQPAKRFLQLQKTFRAQALHDPLTGAFNRGAVLDMLERELKRGQRLGYPVAVVMADLDGLKEVNDSVGHLAGDAVLIAVAKRIGGQLRQYDVIGRYGGDEFLLILSDCNAARGLEVCERVKNAVTGTPVVVSGHPVSPSISLGLASAPVKAPIPVAAIIQQADMAMYEAKRAGKNRVSTL